MKAGFLQQTLCLVHLKQWCNYDIHGMSSRLQPTLRFETALPKWRKDKPKAPEHPQRLWKRVRAWSSPLPSGGGCKGFTTSPHPSQTCGSDSIGVVVHSALSIQTGDIRSFRKVPTSMWRQPHRPQEEQILSGGTCCCRQLPLLPILPAWRIQLGCWEPPAHLPLWLSTPKATENPIFTSTY